MSAKPLSGANGKHPSLESIGYVRQMLAELAQIARRENAEFLAYLMEMAFTEASDLVSGKSGLGKIERNHATGMAMKPAGKV